MMRHQDLEVTGPPSQNLELSTSTWNLRLLKCDVSALKPFSPFVPSAGFEVWAPALLCKDLCRGPYSGLMVWEASSGSLRRAHPGF